MIKKLIEFQKVFNNRLINLSIPFRYKIIRDFTCYLLKDLGQAGDLQNLLNKSEIVIIDKIGEPKDQYYVIFIDKVKSICFQNYSLMKKDIKR